MRHFNTIILLTMIMLLSVSQISYSQEIGTPTTSVGHSKPVSSIAVSPNGKLLLSGSWDKTVKLWDIRSRRLLRTMKGHTEKISCVAFSPDGKTAASAGGHWGNDAVIRIWDLVDGSELNILQGHNGCVNSIAFSPDGEYLVSGGGFNYGYNGSGPEDRSRPFDRAVRLWDVSTGKLLRTYVGHGYSVTRVAFTPDGNSILSGGGGGKDHSIIIWDTNSGTILRQFNGHSLSIEALAISPDGETVVSAQSVGGPWHYTNISKKSTIIAWNLNDAKIIRELGTVELDNFSYTNLSDHIEKRTRDLVFMFPRSATFSPNRKYLAIGQDTGIFCVLETENYTLHQIYGANKVISGEPSGIEHDLKSGVFSIAFSSDSESIISGHIDSQIKLWDSKTGKLIDTFPSQLSGVSAAKTTNENAYEVIYYPETGLEWCAGSNLDIYWEQANKWVGSLKFKGGNWRMPTGKELRDLNECENNAYPNQLVKGFGPCVWSSDMLGNAAQKHAYAFNFYLPRLSGFYPPDRRSGCCALAVRKKTNN